MTIWIAEVESRTQGPRPTPNPNTKKSEAKDKNAQGKDTGASVLQKKGLQKFWGDLQKRKTKKVFKNFPRGSAAFLHNLKNEQIPTIVGTDANAHRTIWGSSDINPRGSASVLCECRPEFL